MKRANLRKSTKGQDRGLRPRSSRAAHVLVAVICWTAFLALALVVRYCGPPTDEPEALFYVTLFLEVVLMTLCGLGGSFALAFMPGAQKEDENSDIAGDGL